MDSSTLTVTKVNWEDLQPCRHCHQRANGHMDDGKCLFEASSFEPVPFPTEAMATSMAWMYHATEPIRPSHPFPERTKYEVRKDRKLQQRAQKKGRCR
jgi:hypothetical protein